MWTGFHMKLSIGNIRSKNHPKYPQNDRFLLSFDNQFWCQKQYTGSQLPIPFTHELLIPPPRTFWQDLRPFTIKEKICTFFHDVLVFSFCICARVPPVTTNKSDLKLYLSLLFKLNPFQTFPMGRYTLWMQTGLISRVTIVMLHPICASVDLFYSMILESWCFTNSPLTRLWTWNTTTTSTIRVSLLI